MEQFNELIKSEYFYYIFSGSFFILGIFFGWIFSKLNPDNSEEIIDDYVEEIISDKPDEVKEYKPIISGGDIQVKKIETTNKAPKVLVAEDNMVNAKILIKTIAKIGITDVVHVIDGVQAFEERKKIEDFDLILMDINMPNMTGDEATQKINDWEAKNQKIHVPIIAVTANALKGDREKYINAGMDDYTTKPLNKNELFELITKYTGYQTEI